MEMTGMLLAFTWASHCELGHRTQWQTRQQQSLGNWKPISQFGIPPAASLL